MRRYFLPFCLGMLLAGTTFAQQNYWQLIEDSDVLLPRGKEAPYMPEVHATVLLDLPAVHNLLERAPREFTPEAKSRPVSIQLPMPDGQMETFAIYETYNMHPDLAAKYPGIRSFKGHSIQNPHHVVRLGYTYKGFHAAITTPKGYIAIDPYVGGQNRFYFSYHADDYLDGEKIVCGVEGDVFLPEDPLQSLEVEAPRPTASLRGAGEPVLMQRYAMALACTGEFARLVGGTMEDVVSAFDVTMNRINLIWEQEHAIRFQLVANNDRLIYLDPFTDPYENADMGGALLGQNKDVLDRVIGLNNYDIGHVFTAVCNDGVAGIAGGSTCTVGKGRGVTCHFSDNVLFRVSGTMAHEVGHQFSAGHTWANCPGILQQLASSSAFEPGSGNTIMSYSGACGTQNVPGGRFTNFHVGTLQQVYNYTHTGGFGTTCQDTIFASNITPEITLNYEDDFFIPIGTPFVLTAEASDDDEDPLTYSWEQYDLGPVTEIGSPRGNAPLFRSFPPQNSPTRYFPRLSIVIDDDLNNISSASAYEWLPTYSRDMTFRCTVRDNNPEVGGVIWDQVAFKATESAGPFRVLSFDTRDTVRVGEYVNIEWDVANTDKAPVNCRQVNIKLSVDGGFTYPYTLIENVPNDGLQGVTFPDVDTRDARIMVEAADNIFYQINRADFVVAPTLVPGYTLDLGTSYQQVCLPDAVEIDLLSSSLLGYDSLVALSINGLPVGAVTSFEKNPFIPADDNKLTVDLSEVTETEGIFELEIVAVAPSLDTAYRYVQLDLVYNEFKDMVPLEPINGLSGASEKPIFSWHSSPFADSYLFELATSPAFGSSVIYSALETQDTFFVTPDFLDKSTEYFWRVQAINRCGFGAYTQVFAFHTETFNCSLFESQDGPIVISGSGTPRIESEININSSGTVSDLSIPYIEGNHSPVRFIDLKLISPSGEEALLMSDLRCGSQLFKLGFDDDATEPPPCPPNDSKLYQSIDPLSKFIGEETEGKWKLSVKVTDQIGDGGRLEGWNLEFCSNTNPLSPYLVNNDTLFVPPGLSNLVTRPELYAEDDDNTSEEVLFTVVELPEFGELFKDGVLLRAGDTFSQASIDNGNVRYRHNGDDNLFDAFTFTVKDNEGGWFGTPEFIIAIDEDAIVSTNEIEKANQFQLFPNPARDVLNVEFAEIPSKRMAISVFNVQGQLLFEQTEWVGARQLQLTTSALSSGIYFLSIQTENSKLVRKFTIQR
ncbi:MAG: reprolysin-like metallopeptidase [Bacteroidota bacterium]